MFGKSYMNADKKLLYLNTNNPTVMVFSNFMNLLLKSALFSGQIPHSQKSINKFFDIDISNYCQTIQVKKCSFLIANFNIGNKISRISEDWMQIIFCVFKKYCNNYRNIIEDNLKKEPVIIIFKVSLLL